MVNSYAFEYNFFIWEEAIYFNSLIHHADCLFAN